jgi:hypothetical protein
MPNSNRRTRKEGGGWSCFARLRRASQDWVIHSASLSMRLFCKGPELSAQSCEAREASEAGRRPLFMPVQPLGQRAGMSQNEHLAVIAGMDFRSARTSENFFRAFSITCTISAFFFEQTYPTGPNRADNPRACLDGNADHDRMSVGAAGAGRGAGASWHAGQKPVCGDE